MVRKIGIIGMGNVGAALAHELVALNLADDYVLIDKNTAKVEADVLDFKDRLANSGGAVNFIVNDYSALADADVVVSALGHIDILKGTTKSRFAELPHNSHQVKEVARNLVASGFKGVLIVITNPVDIIAQFYQELTGFPKERVIGTGTLLDTARMKRVVGERFGLAPASVSGYNLGEHGNSQFTAWSQVKVKGQMVSELLSADELSAMEENSRYGGYKVLLGKGYTNYAIVAAARRLVVAVLTDSQELLPVSNYMAELDCYVGYPAVIGRQGVLGNGRLSLTDKEKQQLANSAKQIKSHYRFIKTGELSLEEAGHWVD